MSHTNKYLWGHTVLWQHNYFCCECAVKALKEIHSCAESQCRDSTVQESCCSFLHRIFVVYDPWAGVILPWVHKLSGKGICYVIFDIHHHMMHRKWQHNDFSHKNSSEKKVWVLKLWSISIKKKWNSQILWRGVCCSCSNCSTSWTTTVLQQFVWKECFLEALCPLISTWDPAVLFSSFLQK